MEPDDETRLKLEINNFLWMYLPGQVCMKHAETLAYAILLMMQDATGRHSQEAWDPMQYPQHARFPVRNARNSGDATKRGICYSFKTHFDIHWDDGSHTLDIPELSERCIFKDE